MVSPLAPERFPEMPPVPGVRVATAACALNYRDRPDVLLAEVTPKTSVAGVFTRSLTASAPVEWCRKALTGGQARLLVVNAGNANAFTGRGGIASVARTVKASAELFACRPSSVFIASTGVIGEPLSDDKITDALAGLQRGLGDSDWPAAARAIMTTDTYPKGATLSATIGETQVTLNGIAKGSGMIGPDMATMLAYVFTDAAIPSDVLQALLSRIVDRTFNCITVDGDTSTSDTLMAFATGQARHPAVTAAGEPLLRDFARQLESLLLDLAHQIVRDGEGAEKFISITVSGAASRRAARRIGLSIANSPLVKTAVAGADANWGRIVAAVGKAGEKADRDKLAITIGGVTVARDGSAVDGYDEAPVERHMKGRDVDIDVDVGVGRGRATVWTCDLTHGYISINVDYRS